MKLIIDWANKSSTSANAKYQRIQCHPAEPMQDHWMTTDCQFAVDGDEDDHQQPSDDDEQNVDEVDRHRPYHKPAQYLSEVEDVGKQALHFLLTVCCLPAIGHT